jgi:hypothetical protein
MRSNFPRFYSFIEALPLKNTGSNLFSEAKKNWLRLPGASWNILYRTAGDICQRS